MDCNRTATKNKVKVNKKVITTVIGFLLGVGALLMFLLRLSGNWSELWESAGMVRYGILVPGFLFLALMYALRVYRWKLLLLPDKGIRFRLLANAIFIGLLANNLLPARAGELIRPYVLKRSGRVNFSQALASVLLDRVFDLAGIILLAIFVLVLLFLRPQEARLTLDLGDHIRGGAVVLASVLTAALLAFTILSFFRPRLFRRLAFLPGKLLPEKARRPVADFTNSTINSILAIQNMRTALLLLVLSVGIWFFQGLCAFFVAASIGLNIGLCGALLVTLVTCFAIALPQAPGYVGTYHLAAALAAESLGASQASAGAFAILLWGVNVLPVTLLGLLLLIRGGLVSYFFDSCSIGRKNQ